MRTILIVCSFVLLFACGNSTKTVDIYYPNGELHESYTINPETEQKNGEYKRFTEDAVMIETAEYSNGVLNGERRIYYTNGKPELLETYKDGNFEGTYRYYYENGNVELEGEYVGGAMEGTWTRYYLDGQVMEKVEFSNNEENGPFVEYHENGKLKAEGTYLDGDNEHGELKLYDETGTLVRKMDCNNGICRTTWEKEEEQNENTEVNEE